MNNVVSKHVAGVDIDSKKLVVSLAGRKVREFKNRVSGINRLITYLKKYSVTLVICEPTGGYEQLFVETLWTEDIPLHLVHSKAVRNFGKVLKRLAKTDPVDSMILREFGERMNPAPTARPALELTELRHMVSYRNDLRKLLVQDKNRLSAPGKPTWMMRELRGHLRFVVRKIKELDLRIEAHLQKHSNLTAAVTHLKKEHGVAAVTAALLVAELPELGTLNRKTAPALVGLAPYNHDSGKFKGKRTIHGGRTSVRCALYMVAMTVIRKSGVLRTFYLRLLKAGKQKMVALVAVMRKLVIRLNTHMRQFRAMNHSVQLCS